MPILTTKVLGLDEKEKADPHPVTGINYAGEPMKPGAFYNGRPEHMDPKAQSTTASPTKPSPKGKQRSPQQLQRLRDHAAMMRAKWREKYHKRKEREAAANATPEVNG